MSANDPLRTSPECGVLEMQLLKACEIGAGLFGLMALFGALFAGFSWLAAMAIAIGVAVLILLMCPVGKT
jgi:hypothetical protein